MVEAPLLDKRTAKEHSITTIIVNGTNINREVASRAVGTNIIGL
jgi:hypothetical protein